MTRSTTGAERRARLSPEDQDAIALERCDRAQATVRAIVRLAT